MTLNHQFRRTMAVLAAAVIGLVAALTFAAPASAHTGQLTSEAPCTDTGWNAVWTLTTTNTGGHDGVLSNVKLQAAYEHIPPGGGPDGRGPSLTTFRDGAEIAGDTTVSETLELNPFTIGVTLSFTVSWTDGDQTHSEDLSERVDMPTDCDWPAPVEPSQLTHAADCTSLTFTLVNPAAGEDEVTVRLKPSTGEERVLTAAAGETKTERFPATTGFSVEIDGPPLPPDTDPEVVTYRQPAGCETGGGAGGDEEGGGTLPVTGANAGTVAIAAGTLLAAGAVLVVLARRRRTRFTA